MRVTERKRTLYDKLICLFLRIHYAIVERRQLAVARREFGGPRFKNGKVSILLPTRNRWDILMERALPSILAQTYDNWELIIINDGGTKREFHDKRITVVNIPKLQHYPDEPLYHWLVGPSNALNEGLKYISGEYIARLDDDDEWLPDMLETMVDFIEYIRGEFVSAYWMNDDREIINPYIHGLTRVGGVQTWLYRSYLKFFNYNLDSWRKNWDKNNEIDLYKRMMNAGVKFDFLPQVVCKIRPRPGVSDIGLKGYLEEHKNG